MKQLLLTCTFLLFTLNMFGQRNDYFFIGISFGGESLIGAPKIGYQYDLYNNGLDSRGYLTVGADVFVFFTGVFSLKAGIGLDEKSMSSEASLAYTYHLIERQKNYQHLSFTPKLGYTNSGYKFMVGPSFYLWKNGYQGDLPLHNIGKIRDSKVHLNYDLYFQKVKSRN